MSAYEVRPYRAGDEGAINAAFNRVFGTERGLAEWRWKFSGSEDLIFVAAGGDARLFAHFSATRAQLRVHGEAVRCAQGVDLFRVPQPDPGAGGAFLRTGRVFFDTVGNRILVDAFYGFPGRDSLRVGGRYFQYAMCGVMANWTKPGGSRWRRWVATRRTRIAPPDAEIDALWARASKRYAAAVDRGSKYIERRYRSHPCRRYEYLSTRSESGLAGLGVAVRIGDVLHWCDLIWDGENPKALDDLESQIWSLALEQGARRIEMWLRGDETALARLRSLGWEAGPSDGQPFFSVISNLPAYSSTALGDLFYITKGDSDLV